MHKFTVLNRLRSASGKTISRNLHAPSTELTKSFILDGHDTTPLPAPQIPLDVIERKEVMSDAYCKILSSPIRMCMVTRARLPNDLLIPFVLVPHPQKREDWIMSDYARTKHGQRRYILNSKKLLQDLSAGAWKRLHFPIKDSSGRHANKRVWREDMVAFVERDMARHAPHIKLGE